MDLWLHDFSKLNVTIFALIMIRKVSLVNRKVVVRLGGLVDAHLVDDLFLRLAVNNLAEACEDPTAAEIGLAQVGLTSLVVDDFEHPGLQDVDLLLFLGLFNLSRGCDHALSFAAIFKYIDY